MNYIVVGSGPSGANAALTLLKRGKVVELWDVGREDAVPPHPERNFHELKGSLDDPQAYFLGKDFEALVPPGSEELLVYPPVRNYVVREDDSCWPFVGEGFKPVISFNRGGLGVGWGANALCYNDDDLRDFPVSFQDYEAAYREAFSRVPVTGPHEDDLSPFLRGVQVSQPSVKLSHQDMVLYGVYLRKASSIQARFGVILGQARMAVVTGSERFNACRYCARCLWGCPHGSIYDPAKSTFEACSRYPHFRYRPGRLVHRLESVRSRVRAVHYLNLLTQRVESEPCDAVFLAAGALQTGAIFLRTLQADERAASGKLDASRTRSVMDTHVVKIPYVQLRCIGQDELQDGFQFNRLILAHIVPERGPWPRYIHGEILSLTSLLYHPLIESLPLGSRFSKELFFKLKPALGAVSLFFPDLPEPGNGLALEPDSGSPTGDRIRICYMEAGAKREMMRPVVKDTVKALFHLGCLVQPGGIRYCPPGSGIHYAGTVPMGPPEDLLCTTPTGRSNAYENLYVADGASFPSLPSKSITMTLIAHAIRTAELAA